MKKLIFILAFIGSSAIGYGQQTAVLTDSDGSVWINAKWSSALISPNGQPTINGIPLTQAQQFASGSTNGSGALSSTLTPNNTIDQANTSWQFTIQPNASSGPSIVSATITSTTQNLTTVLNAGIKAPRFPANSTAYGYADVEVTSAVLGASYYNTTTPTLRQFSLAGWTSVAGGGGGGVSSVGATGNAVVTTTVTNPTTTPLIALTLTSAPANTVLSNSTGSAAAPTYTTTPAFTGSSITGLNFTQLGGAATIAQVPATLVQAVGTVSANTSLRWVTGNTATNGSLADNGTAITTSVPITASAFNGSASGLTAFPTGQFANPGIVNAVTRGLNFEYHFQEASGATSIVDYSGANNPGTVTGTVGLTGTLVGGMNVCSTGCVGSVAPSGYVSIPAALSTDPTLQFYTCTNSLTAAGITGGFTDIIAGGLISATAPSGGTTQATGLFIQGGQGNSLSTNASSVAKFAIAPGMFNNATVTAQSINALAGCHLITVVRQTAPTTDLIYIDGNLSSGGQFTGTGTLQQAIIGSIAIGTPPYATLSTNYKHPYPVYYAAGSSVAWTAEEVQRSYGSIQSSMGFRGVVQLPPVYSDAGNQIVAGIDSLTFGYNSASVHGWPFYLSNNPKPGAVIVTTPYPVVTNLGIVGLQLKQAIAECQSGKWQAAINPNSPTTFLFWGATNDVTGTATAAAGLPAVLAVDAHQRLHRLVQCAKGLNPQPRVIVATMISRGVNGSAANGTGVNSSTPLETLKQQNNDLMRADYAGADGMFDMASIPALGADGASLVSTGTACVGTSSTAYFTGDSVHLTDCGQQTAASYWSAYLNYLDNKFGYTNPTTITAATYPETSADVAINANPAAVSTITLPTAVGLVGTDRQIANMSAFVVTVAAAAGEVINVSSTSVACIAGAVCKFRSVLGTSQGVASPNATSGAHWEQF